MKSTIFKGAKILTMCDSAPSIFEGAVGVVGNKIAMVSADSATIEAFCFSHPEAHVIDSRGKLLMPGLINTHCHVAMTLQRNSGDDIELMEWLNDTVWPFEARQSEEDIVAGARLGVAEMLLSGTTTFVDMYWSEQHIASAIREMGIRAVLGESCLEGRMPSFEKNLSELVEVAKTSSRITAAVAPHAPYTCTPEIYKRCAELAKEHNIMLITHLDEAPTERATIQEMYNLSPTEYLDKQGMLTPSTILAHSIHLTPSDVALIAERGAHIAHNPQCNMKIASGAAPITSYIEAGVNIGIGTDGVCSNNDLDMWDEMRTGAFLQKLSTGHATAMPAYQMLKMATVNGAKAVGQEGRLGVIKEGALADIILLDISRPHYRPIHNIASAILYCGKAADVATVMVDGEILVDNYTLLGADLEAICSDVEQRSTKIFKALGRE